MRALDFASHRPRRLLFGQRELWRNVWGAALILALGFVVAWRRCNRPFGRFMAAVGEVKWVLVRGSKFGCKLESKHVRKTGLALVDFLDGQAVRCFQLRSCLMKMDTDIFFLLCVLQYTYCFASISWLGNIQHI